MIYSSSEMALTLLIVSLHLIETFVVIYLESTQGVMNLMISSQSQ